MGSLPSEAEIRSLPLWAAVSFGARCARRVLPLFRDGYPKARKQALADLERAVSVAEEFAGLGRGRPDYAAEADGDHAVDVNLVAEKWARDPAVANFSDAAGAAAYAAGAAADVTADAAWADRELVYSSVLRAVRRAATSEQTVPGIADDYRHLAAAVRVHGWNDTQPVPTSFYEPLEAPG